MATLISTELIGVNKLQMLLLALGRKSQRALAKSLYQEAQVIMRFSKQQVPVEKGTLKNSGAVESPVTDSDGTISVRMGYGGAAGAYALVQHENLQFRHPRGGNAKFLERPLLAAMPGLTQRIGNRLKAELETLHETGAGSPGGTGLL